MSALASVPVPAAVPSSESVPPVVVPVSVTGELLVQALTVKAKITSWIPRLIFFDPPTRRCDAGWLYLNSAQLERSAADSSQWRGDLGGGEAEAFHVAAVVDESRDGGSISVLGPHEEVEVVRGEVCRRV